MDILQNSIQKTDKQVTDKMKQQKICLNVARRNQHLVDKLHILMEESNLSMTDTLFQMIKKEYNEYERKADDR